MNIHRNIVYIYGHINPTETNRIVQLVVDRNIKIIYYVKIGHSCKMTPLLNNTQLLRERGIAVVWYPYSLKDGLKIKLHTIRTALSFGMEEFNIINVGLNIKTETALVGKCICGVFDPPLELPNPEIYGL